MTRSGHAQLAVLGAVVALLGTACGDDGADGPPTSGAGAGDPATYADVQQIFASSCAVPTCHASMVPSFGLDLQTDPHAAVVDVQASNMMVLVEPGDPEASYLFEKVSSDMPASGTRMPPGRPLAAEQIEMLRSWIADGAPR